VTQGEYWSPQHAQRAAMKHEILVDHPSAKERLAKTWCGRYVHAFEIAASTSEISCPACLRAIEQYESLNI
jgi:hypothetical protein